MKLTRLLKRSLPVILGLIVVIVIVILAVRLYRKGADPTPTPASPLTSLPIPEPSHQSLYFQNLPPTPQVENRYHEYILKDCGGDYNDYKCRQRAYIKTMKDGTFDKADLICDPYKNDEERYYQCLDGVYGNYLWMDRFTGPHPCVCPDGKQGASGSKGECYCPPERALNQRNPLDENMQPVMRIL